MSSYSNYSTILIGFIFCCLCFSCENKKEELLIDFNNLYQHTIDNDYDQILAGFDQASLNYYESITSVDNANFENVKSLGGKYDLPYSTAILLATQGTDQEHDKKHFFDFLANNNVSFFKYYDVYQAIPDKSRMGKENFIAVYRLESDSKMMTWLKFTEEAPNEFKYNLIYDLQKSEKELKDIFEANLEDKSAQAKHQNIEKIYNTYFTKYFHGGHIDSLSIKRKAQYEQLSQAVLNHEK